MNSSNLRYSQNFLTDPGLVRYLVRSAGISPGDTVFEVGPGRGSITKFLIEAVGRTGSVTGVELDKNLAAILQDRYRDVANVSIQVADILEFDLGLLASDYKVFSNIPFNITSELLELLFNPIHGPNEAYLILQEDILQPNTFKNKVGSTFKSLLVEPLYEIESVYQFKKTDFFPEPGVDTALFYFRKRRQPLIDTKKYALYKDFLAFISKDRVGEGAWTKLFSKKQLEIIAQSSDLYVHKGLKSQKLPALLAAFTFFSTQSDVVTSRVNGAIDTLRSEQKHKQTVDQAGGHHRSKRLTGLIAK